MQRLFILGCGGFGQQIASLLPDHPGFGKEWEIQGFLDAKTDFGGRPSRYPLLGNEDTFPFRADDLIILAIASTEAKERLMHKLASKISFFTFIHPSARVLDFATVGEGSIIYPNCIVSCNVKIGRFVTLNSGTQVGHDASIGDFSSLMTHVDLGGGVSLGAHVFMGTKATVVPGKTIADHTQIAAGSVVMRSIRNPGCTYMGNPAVKFE